MIALWRTNKSLRVELRAARLSSSAAQKKVNRLTARVKVLDAACAKHHEQARHDQLYIDHLEAQLSAATISDVRSVLGARSER